MSSVAPSDPYPASPTAIPEDLTKPGSGYIRHAWLAILGLVVWIVLYLAIAGWFVWTTIRYAAHASAGGADAWIGYVMALPTAFLATFMLKALFFVKRGGEPNDLEVTPEQEPRLFAFLHRLADEAGAPRPHRVFLSHRVNAAVFYDLSLANLILPSRKNLEIGLGLVNVLSLAELKAVLAHEFGHFAQRSMAVGSWVYIAQQIAGHIIHQRDILDRFLRGLSNFDLRIAWIGWILRLIVWSLRSLLETAFHGVILAQRALSREMEFQADLVAVSLTGSDALIHALHRLQTADFDLDRALSIAGEEIDAGRAVEDVFSIQSKVSERIRAILDDDEYGTPPALPTEHARASHRVFDREDVQAPRMWSTHPPNRDREDNAKRRYVAVVQDDRPAWIVFEDADRIRKSVTSHLLAQATEGKALAPSTTEQTLDRIDERYGRIYYESRYRGAFLNRSIVRDVKRAEDLFDPPMSEDEAREALDTLYPRRLVEELERVRQLDSEVWTLEALRDRRLAPHDGVIRHRGEELAASDLAPAIEALRVERAEANALVLAHDRRVRTVHRDLATNLSPAAGARVTGLVELLHYSEHSEAELLDARGELINVWSIVTADGKISRRERKRLLATCAGLHRVLESIYEVADQVVLDHEIAWRLELASWGEALGPWELGPPDKKNLDDWLGVIDSWMDSALGWLGALRQHTFEVLLEVESEVERCVRFGGELEWEEGECARIPAEYATQTPGEERELQRRLGLWDRFQVADGFFPTIARMAVALLVIGGAVFAGGMIGNGTVSIYNGLSRSIEVEMADRTLEVQPYSRGTLSVEPTEALTIETRSLDGALIERFEADASDGFVDYVYNVAGASPLVAWTAVYGDEEERPQRHLGAPRWTTTTASILFEDPPESIDTRNEGGTRSVLSGQGDADPDHLVGLLQNEDEALRMVRAHARWDTRNSPWLLDWLALAARIPDGAAVLEERLAMNPEETVTWRLRMDLADASTRPALCREVAARAAAAPEDADRQYLAVRCLEDEDTRDAKYLAGHARFPRNGWFSMAAGFTFVEGGEWQRAERALARAMRALPMMTDSIAPEIARVRRYLNDDALGGGSIVALAERSPALAFELALENGDADHAPPLQAYTMLEQGRLEEAIERASGGRGNAPRRVVLLAAASDGATPELLARAQKVIDDDVLDANVFWSNAGLALRGGAELSSLVERYTALGLAEQARVGDGVWRFLESVLREESLELAELHLDGSSARERGLAYTAAVVALGDRAPREWRRGAMRLLFVSERPYFDLAGR